MTHHRKHTTTRRHRWTQFAGATLLATLAISASMMSQTSPAPVDLGTSGDFVILAKTGITTTGVTAITGDIGVSPATATVMTGFGLIMDATGTFATSSLLIGKAYAADYTDPTPTKMTTAIADMQTAYTDAAGRVSPDYTELHAGDVTGQTLTRGLYKWGTSLQISGGGVTISGSSTDVWIFQIAQDLVVANGANVTLSGGAKPANIFWQVAGQVTVGTTAQMKGVLLCQTQISMNSGASLDGRALAQTAVTTDGNAISEPTSITGVSGVDLPREYSLAQNFPNPFNPSTTIAYDLKESGHVSLTVFSLLGHEVATLVSGYQEAGTYTVPFNTETQTRTLSSGVYFYRLEAGAFVSMKRLVLLK